MFQKIIRKHGLPEPFDSRRGTGAIPYGGRLLE